MVLEPGQGNVRVNGTVEKPGVTVGDFLQAVAVQHHHRRRAAGPIGLVRLGRPPAAVIAHAVVELERMNFQQVEIHRQRRGETAVARPTAAELRFHAIEAPAPVPVIVALAKHGPVCVARS